MARRPPAGRVPHFELVFYLTMETFGKVHPDHRNYAQWIQMTEHERELHRRDVAQLHVDVARRFEHGAIFVRLHTPGGLDDVLRVVELIREISGDEFAVLLGGDTTYGIPNGRNMEEWCAWLYENLDEAKRQAGEKVERTLRMAERVARHGGVDGFALTSDYCFNTGPFLSPAMFSEVVTPYLARLCRGYRERGFFTVKHTDGNILPILDQLMQAGPDALHSLDPQGGIDMADIKRRVGDRVCLIGNVNCGLLQTGTDEQVIESARYALRHGMPGGGYIFSTSNCIFTGMTLARYELILDVWRREGNYALPPEPPREARLTDL
jgi:uroporphyrinogen decarboxylase